MFSYFIFVLFCPFFSRVNEFFHTSPVSNFHQTLCKFAINKLAIVAFALRDFTLI